MAVVIALVIYLSAAALPRGRPAAVGIAVGFVVVGLTSLTVPAAGETLATLYRLYLVLAAVGLSMAAVAQAVRMALPREGVLARVYPAVVLTVAVLAPVVARAILG